MALWREVTAVERVTVGYYVGTKEGFRKVTWR